MCNLRLTKENMALALITILSGILNFVNLNLEGTGNAYYAAAVKSMTMNFKNFFFVSFDPAGFVTIDKPPFGYWLQAISAKLFGFSGWSIILPQALAGVVSVVTIFYIVKRSFGSTAGLIASLCLTVTPVFVAVSRNNTVDNLLVLVLLLACWALSIAVEKGRFKYLILSMVLVGIGFNIKMLQAYMVIPALYITYLLSTTTSFKKRMIHLAVGTVVLIAVSLSWTMIVDSIPASSRPYVDSSTNNTVMELIVGHNGLERISLSSKSKGPVGAPSGNMQLPAQPRNYADSTKSTRQNDQNQDFPGDPSNNNQGFHGNPPSNIDNQGFTGGSSPNTNPYDQRMGRNMPGEDGPNIQRPGGGMQGPGGGGLQGSFGGEVKSGITRLFSKNILSDQIVWFIPLAVFGFIAAVFREKLGRKLDNERKQSLVLWFMWFLPVFVYFSYNTGTFHSYYLTMLAPPVAALAGIGITSMWEFHKEGGWKSWLLPIALLSNGAVQLLMLSYFKNLSSIIEILNILVIILCFASSVILSAMHLIKNNTFNLDKILVSLALLGIFITPFVGSSQVLFHSLNSSFPAAGLELLSNNQQHEPQMNGGAPGNSNSNMVDFLLNNKTDAQKYLLVVSSANEAADIIINTGEPVMAIGGFLGNDMSITLNQFIDLAKRGEVRYVMTGGNRGGGREGNSASEIMNWVQKNGKAVSASENTSGFAGRGFEQLYDLKSYTDSFSGK